MEIFAVILFLGFFASLWVLYCNEMTHKQRMALLSNISTDAKNRISDGRNDYLANYHLMDEVDYDRHLWALACFQNPKNLYSEELQGFL